MHSDLSDYLLAEIAVVDVTGAIVRTNRKWEQPAKIGKLARKQQAGTTSLNVKPHPKRMQ